MLTITDPSDITPEERCAEVATIFTAGFLCPKRRGVGTVVHRKTADLFLSGPSTGPGAQPHLRWPSASDNFPRSTHRANQCPHCPGASEALASLICRHTSVYCTTAASCSSV